MTPSALASNFKNVPGAIFLLLTPKRKLHKEGGTHILRGVIDSFHAGNKYFGGPNIT